MQWDLLLSNFIVLWAVIDPIGTVPVFIAVTKDYDAADKRRIARTAAIVSFLILAGFLVAGEFLLQHMGVPLPAFQTAGGIILLLFALDMVFGSSKPEGELNLIKSAQETAVFPLAIPSIAGPGAILAVILLTDNSRHSSLDQLATGGLMLIVIVITYFMMRGADLIHRAIGKSGAIVVSKVMGLILASIASTNILIGIKEFFKL